MPKPVAEWPLLLCGPMLRSVTPTSVSVFVALKHPRKIRLSVLPPGTSTTPLGEIEVDSRKLGACLHVALVTLTLGAPLRPGNTYRYDITLTASGARDPLDTGPAVQTLGSMRLLTGSLGLGYDENALPSFALPPGIAYLKLAHGSCRKPHGERTDAFPILDTIIRHNRSDPYARPHQLFLTGDQIYADDVAEPLLYELMPTAEALLGWDAPELIPGLAKPPSEIRPGDRSWVVHPPLTSGEANSHLMTLGEYYAMYLFVWSPELWPSAMPKFAQLPKAERDRYGGYAQYKDPYGNYGPNTQERYDGLVDSVWRFHNSLGKVRRALANVPTYMIFDDHEITDDWFLHREAWDLAQNNEVANRIIANGLAAYAVFQAWGNTPEQFQPGQVGHILLDALRDWRGRDDASFVPIQSAVQVPQSSGVGLRWDYEVVGPQHQVIVLDTRTKRGYPSGDKCAAPDLLTPAAMYQQITARKRTPNKQVTILVAPAPVFGHWAHMTISDALGAIGDEAGGDREAWLVRDRRQCFESLLQALVPFKQVIILSGDVHYGFSFLVHYWDERQKPDQRATFAQFTSSAFKNEADLTRHLGAIPWGSDVALAGAGPLLAARRAGFLGWSTPGRHLLSTPNDFDPGGTPSYVEGTPAVARVPDDLVADILKDPEWRYRSEMISDKRTALERGVPVPTVNQTGTGWFARNVELVKRHLGLAEYDQMRTVVGHNNMATISFDASPPGSRQTWLYAHQRLWFRLMGEYNELRPYTTHSADLTVMSESAIRPTATHLGALAPEVPGDPQIAMDSSATQLDASPPDFSFWSDLISMRPPKSIQQAVRRRFGGSVLDWTGHRLESGQGDINLDFYPVRVTTLPQLAGSQLSAERLLKIIRTAINSFVGEKKARFVPYDDAVDGPVWLSDTALGTVISIHVYPFGLDLEVGSVVCSSFRPDRWVFSTLWTPKDAGHPVSGNRAFGYMLNEDGSYTFYTRGADRTTGFLDFVPAKLGLVFSAADQVWLSLQDGIVNYVESHEGAATKEPRLSNRYPWPEVSATHWRPVEDWIR